MKREEQQKNEIAKNYFAEFDATEIIGNIDFAVALKSNIFETQYLLWAEAKKGTADIENSICQLVLTIGKAKTYTKHLPPKFIGCFDEKKIAFIEYDKVQSIFSMNDFNWNVTPSDYKTKEFNIVLEQVKNALNEKESYIFDFEKQDSELKAFIKNNFIIGGATSKIKIDKNNFTHIYYKWLKKVKETIQVPDWGAIKKHNILDSDFYLADLLSEKNTTIDFAKKLRILLESNKYKVATGKSILGGFDFKEIGFSDNQKAHKEFWNIYERPPRDEYWDYMIERRDLLVPQDFRERKGSFFTPRIWVEKSQEYIAKTLGQDWQTEYYIWDCACGTGNLLAGLLDKYKIFASDIEQANISVLHSLIDSGSANLLENHCFQFDFLNDDFTKLPDVLQNIIKNEPHKLLIFINPPYAEHGNKREMHNKNEEQKSGVSFHKTRIKYKDFMGSANNEIFAQFLMRIYKEIPKCKIANFSTLKNLLGSNFQKFREVFTPKLKKLFLIPADTFDNVKGQFPIGFFVWDGKKTEIFKGIKADIYDKDEKFAGTKNIYSYDGKKRITAWASENKDKKGKYLGNIWANTSDFQNNNLCWIQSEISSRSDHLTITPRNLLVFCIYFSVRKVIKADWLNDRDSFLYPNNKWKKDREFQKDCLAYTLFHTSNNIKSEMGENHWIPFYEKEVDAKEKFKSNFIADFISGKIKNTEKQNGFHGMERECFIPKEKLEFSKEAKAVFEAGKELWKYYHSKSDANPNASFYDIRGYFQGFKILANGKKRMNPRSADLKYTELLKNLKDKMQILGDEKIVGKVYEYEFLLE